MQLTQRTRFDELKAANTLPSPSGVALAIIRLVEKPETTVQEISRVLESDPAMAGRVLKLVNSAQSGTPRPISSIKEAVTRLGLRSVRNLALCISLISESKGGACKHFDYKKFWSGSLATAIAAQMISVEGKYRSPDEAFTCGLVCQVGKLALASLYPRDYDVILAEGITDDPAALVAREQDLFATDHNDLTAALLEDWGLPPVCAQAARYYEDPETAQLPDDSGAQALAGLLHLATHLGGLCIARDDQRADLMPELLARGQAIGLTEDRLLALGDRVAGLWREWGKIFNVTTLEVPSLATIVERNRPEETPAVVEDVAVEPPAGTAVEGIPADSPTSREMTILVVEDSPIEAKLLEKYLTSGGHRVLRVRNGQEAMSMALETNPQMVITDWVMDEMDGLAFCKALRQTKFGRQMYVIMVTGNEAEDKLVEGLEAGADDYVIKPIRPKTLLARIRAGERVIRLQQELTREREELRRHTTELAVVNRKLQQAAFTDTLTGLPNRRFAMERLAQEWASAVERDRPFTCMIADIDHFKQVNDTFGHDVGDLVIRGTAALLQDSVRASDSVCRYGGEEFLIICPAAEMPASHAVAERLRTRVAGHATWSPGFERRITLSIGLAVYAHGVKNSDELLKAADEALYVAKQSGRNQVCQAPF